jgi:phosphoribosylamine--glycine ligase
VKVLVIGGGGREHALAWKIKQSPKVSEIICAPGNAGITSLARCVDIDVTDLNGLLKLALAEGIDLSIVGPELPLTMGIVDLFKKEGLKIFGTSQRAAILEGSKAFSKDLMRKYKIPTGYYQVFTDRNEAERFIREVGPPIVVKADGLAAGKGVIVSQTLEEALDALTLIMDEKVFGSAGDKVVVEEFLEGEEASFLAFTDGHNVLPMASSQDHKPVYDNDQGPNTGGMGAYSPAPVITDELHHQIMEEIMIPTVRGMAAEGRPFQGILYGGLMISDSGPKVLEFNVRFGDPEAQPILPRMENDLVPILESCIEGRLDEETIRWKPEAAICVVMASGGYPRSYEKGKKINGLEEAGSLDDLVVFHAGTALEDGKVVTAGGRVLGITALGKSIQEAIEKAYEGVSLIQFEGAHFRRDIGRKALNRPSGE